MKRNIYTILFGIIACVGIAGCGSESQEIPELIEPILENVQEEEDVEKTIINVYDAVVIPQSTEYSFDSYGYVEYVYVSVGDRVKKGDLMATLYSYDLQDEWEKIRLMQSEIDNEIRQLESERIDGSRTDQEVALLRKELRKENLLEKIDKLSQNIDFVIWKGEERRLYAEADGIVVGTALKPGNVVQAGQPVIMIYSENGNVIVSSLIARDELEEADHVYTVCRGKQVELSFIKNTENNSYFACPDDFEAGDDADIAVIINGDAVLEKENYTSTVKAETVYAGQDGVTAYSKCGGTLRFISFLNNAHVELKAGDPIASYYEDIDPLYIKDCEFEAEYLRTLGEEKKADELEAYIEEMYSAIQETLMVAPYDGVCVKFENFYAGKEINNGAAVARFSPVDGRKLRLTDTNGKFRYGQRVSVAGKVNNEDFVGHGVVISVSKYDLGADYNDGKAIVVLDEDSQALYNSYNVFVSVEGSQYKLKK